MPNTTPSTAADGRLARFVRATARRSAARPKTVVALWLTFVIGCLVASGVTGTRMLNDSEQGVGQSGRADVHLHHSGLMAPAVESVLVRSGDASKTRDTAHTIAVRLARLPQIASVRGPDNDNSLLAQHGRAALVQATLRGDPDDAGDHVGPVRDAVAAVHHRGVTVSETGDGSISHAFDSIVAHDLQRAEMISLPVTLLILVLAFGALVAASVPLLLGLTSVAAAIGLLGPISQAVPAGDPTASIVVLIGLAVGVDYSLFAIRRERAERRAGATRDTALETTAATVGRAIVVSGLTVIVALAGLLITRMSIFTSMAVGAMAVAAIAVLGSLTVLPALLSLLGDRIDKGRLWPRRKRVAEGGRVSTLLARGVTARPRTALVAALVVLGGLAGLGLTLKTADAGIRDLPKSSSTRAANEAMLKVFPGSPDTSAHVVVTGRDLGTSAARTRMDALGSEAARVAGTGAGAHVATSVARDGRTALVTVAVPDRGRSANRAMVERLRSEVVPDAAKVAPGAHALLSGDAANDVDFSDRMHTATPIVLALVLGLALALLVGAFGSVKLAVAVVSLNLVSVGAAFGLLVAVFQHGIGAGALGFDSTGAIEPWLPLFAFVILFGLSMDYTVLVLERIHEARRRGVDARTAAREGVAATAGTVTSAAVVMVAVFAVFATLTLLEFKQMGIGLAGAVLLDATLVRGVALPAIVALLGDRHWAVRRVRRPVRAATPEKVPA